MTTTETTGPSTASDEVLLAQVIRIERGVKQRVNKDVGAAQKEFGRTPQLTGLDRTYRPKDTDDTELLPSEQTKVQVNAEDILVRIGDQLADLFNVVYTRENGNTLAKADIVIGDTVILPDVPVTYMLFLEKQLDDLADIVKTLPVLDPAEEWTWDPNSNAFRTPARVTTRSKKVPFSFVKAPAVGEKIAAQVEVMYEDKVVGFWEKVSFSGAMEAERVLTMKRRVEALRRAVKFARESANATKVPETKTVGAAIINYILAP